MKIGPLEFSIKNFVKRKCGTFCILGMFGSAFLELSEQPITHSVKAIDLIWHSVFWFAENPHAVTGCYCLILGLITFVAVAQKSLICPWCHLILLFAHFIYWIFIFSAGLGGALSVNVTPSEVALCKMLSFAGLLSMAMCFLSIFDGRPVFKCKL